MKKITITKRADGSIFLDHPDYTIETKAENPKFDACDIVAILVACGVPVEYIEEK